MGSDLMMKLILAASWSALLLALSACATPAPTGTYAVGRTNTILVDVSRPEVVTPDPADRREVPLVIWYPAEPGSGSSTGYFPGIGQLSKTLSASGDVSKLEVWGLRFVGSRERLNARLSDARPSYPVVLLSPGNGTNVEFFDSIAGNLASHGFVVVGFNPPYDAASVLLSSGRPAVHPSDLPFEWGAGRVAVRTADMLFALEQFKARPFPGAGSGQFPFERLDLSRVGVMGHSLGGVAAAQACYTSAQVRSCLNVDGIQRGGPFGTTPVEQPPAQPFMFLTKEQNLPEQTIAKLAATGSESFLVVMPPGTRHDNFADGGALLPGPGRSRAIKLMSSIRAYTLAFFEETLNGRPSPLLAGSSTSEGVRVRAFRAKK
jgi:hypothetical protein